jgi:hypothetical protein
VAFDLELLDRFSTFAKRIGYGPYLEMGFHRSNGPTSVRVQGLSSFYGICMPRQLVFDEAMPRWVQSQVPDRQVPTDEVFLSQIQGEAHLSGVDQHDRTWVQFEVDPLAEQAPGACSICGVKISAGWQCGDGGDEVCGDHVRFTEDMPNLPGIAEAEEPEPGVVAA